MIVILRPGAQKARVEALMNQIKQQGVDIHYSQGATETILGLVGDTSHVDEDWLRASDIVEDVQAVYAALTRAGVANSPAGTVIGSTIYANKPGDGSAREQAASCQRVLGACANIAMEYATKRYRSNCINWGMAPLLTATPEDYALGDWVFVPGIREAILSGRQAFDAYVVKADGSVKKTSVSTGTLTEDERQIIADGCLINYYRNN